MLPNIAEWTTGRCHGGGGRVLIALSFPVQLLTCLHFPGGRRMVYDNAHVARS